MLAVRIAVGVLAAVLPGALRFCFDFCTEGTPLEGARLEILRTAGSELCLKEPEVA